MFTYKIEIKREKKEKDKNDTHTHTQNHAYIVQIDKYITKHTKAITAIQLLL